MKVDAAYRNAVVRVVSDTFYAGRNDGCTDAAESEYISILFNYAVESFPGFKDRVTAVDGDGSHSSGREGSVFKRCQG